MPKIVINNKDNFFFQQIAATIALLRSQLEDIQNTSVVDDEHGADLTAWELEVREAINYWVIVLDDNHMGHLVKN